MKFPKFPKTVWSGIGSIVAGIGLVASGDVPEGIQLIILGIVAITGRQAISKVEARQDVAADRQVATLNQLDSVEKKQDVAEIQLAQAQKSNEANA